MHASRQRILEILKERGAATVDELGRDLSLTTVTIRHHLDILRAEGLVSDPMVRHRATPGRPQYTYTLTEKASEVFPTNYVSLAAQLITEVKACSSEQEVLTFFENVGHRLLTDAPQPEPGEPVELRLTRAVDFLNTRGYLARWDKTTEGYVLFTCNCPYRRVSGTHQELCDMDLSLVGSLLGCELERLGRVTEGDDNCAYLVCQATTTSIEFDFDIGG